MRALQLSLLNSQWRSSCTSRQCSTQHTASQDTSHAHTTSDTDSVYQHTPAVSCSPCQWCESCCHVASSTVELHNGTNMCTTVNLKSMLIWTCV